MHAYEQLNMPSLPDLLGMEAKVRYSKAFI